MEDTNVQVEFGEPDKTMLEDLVAQVEALNEKDYTAESWSALVKALETAKSVLADENATSQQIADAYTGLKTAVDALEKAEQGQSSYELQKGEMDKVPESLKNVFASVTDIFNKMLEQAKKTIQSLTNNTSKLFDLTLFQVLPDGSRVEVTAENFPKDGVLVELPYSDFGTGVGKDTHNFVVTHMFEQDGNGHKAGDVETISAQATDTGLRFTLYSMSPVMVSWAEKSETVPTPTPTPTPNPSNPQQPAPTPVPVVTTPQTGDSNTGTIAAIALTICLVVGGSVAYVKFGPKGKDDQK